MYGKKTTVKVTKRTEVSEMVKAVATSRGIKRKEVHDRLTKRSSTPPFKTEVKRLRRR